MVHGPDQMSFEGCFLMHFTPPPLHFSAAVSNQYSNVNACLCHPTEGNRWDVRKKELEGFMMAVQCLLPEAGPLFFLIVGPTLQAR